MKSTFHGLFQSIAAPVLVALWLAACAAPAYRPGMRTPPAFESGLVHNEIASKLTRSGYAVYAFDLRGHGDSEGDRVWVRNFDEYISDLDAVVSKVRKEEPGKALFIFGHSMGGAIVTLYAITKVPPINGIILSGPALKVTSDISGFKVSVTKILGTIGSYQRKPKSSIGIFFKAKIKLVAQGTMMKTRSIRYEPGFLDHLVRTTCSPGKSYELAVYKGRGGHAIGISQRDYHSKPCYYFFDPNHGEWIMKSAKIPPELYDVFSRYTSYEMREIIWGPKSFFAFPKVGNFPLMSDGFIVC